MDTAEEQQFRRLLSDVFSDLAVVVPSPEFAVFDLSERAWLPGPTVSSFDVPSGLGREGYVACIAGSQSHIEQAAPPVVVREVISVLQETLVDDLWFWWPEYQPEGQFVGILEPVVTNDGVFWALKGTPLVRLGDLASKEADIRRQQG